MNRRLELHQILVSILGSNNVYFQPPESIKINYPAIVYRRNSVAPKFADNELYSKMVRYSVTVIDGNPDSDIPNEIDKLQLCSRNNSFQSDGLNHDVFTIYY